MKESKTTTKVGLFLFTSVNAGVVGHAKADSLKGCNYDIFIILFGFLEMREQPKSSVCSAFLRTPLCKGMVTAWLIKNFKIVREAFENQPVGLN